MEFKSLKLSGNRFEIAPKFTIELNPKEAGKRSHVYFVWPFSPEAYPDIPSLDSVIQEEVPGTLFAYHCDNPDLPVVSYRHALRRGTVRVRFRPLRQHGERPSRRHLPRFHP